MIVSLLLPECVPLSYDCTVHCPKGNRFSDFCRADTGPWHKDNTTTINNDGVGYAWLENVTHELLLT